MGGGPLGLAGGGRDGSTLCPLNTCATIEDYDLLWSQRPIVADATLYFSIGSTISNPTPPTTQATSPPLP